MSQETFGQYLRRKIKEAGRTEGSVAEEVGATSGMMSRWVNDHKIPRPAYVAKLAQALVLDVDDLMRRAGYRPAMLADNEISPERRELLELVRKLPERDVVTFLDFARYRVMLAKATPQGE